VSAVVEGSRLRSRPTVDAVTVAGFSAVPLLVGMAVAAAAARRLPVLLRVGLVVAPALALVAVPMMTLPADFDRVSTLTLALCHVTLVPVSMLGPLALRRAVAEENR
jgi:Cu/Ag efflux pump CusA